MTRLGLAMSLVLAAGGCGILGKGASGTAPTEAGVPGGIRLRQFSEARPVTAVAFATPHLWVGSSAGVLRFNVRTEDMVRLGKSQGLPGEDVSAMAAAANGDVWMATEAGVGRVSEGRYIAAPPPPPAVKRVTALAALPGLGALAAGPTGLYRTDGKTWIEIAALRDVAITSIDVGKDGVAIVGTAGRGLARVEGPDAVRFFSVGEGFDLRDVVGVARLESGVVFAAGRGADGASRLLIVSLTGEGDLLTAQPAVPVQRITRIGGEVVVLAGGGALPRLFKLQSSQRGDPAPQDGFRFVPVRKDPNAPRYAVVPLTLAAPPSTTAVLATDEGLYFATGYTGVARAAVAAPVYHRFGELVRGARRITVACRADDDCLIATGGPALWHFGPQGFDAGSVGQPQGAVVEAMFVDRDGASLAVWSEPGFSGFVVVRREGEEWKPYRRIAVTVPEDHPRLSWVRVAPTGNLWLGVSFQDKSGDVVSFGAVEEDFVRQRTIHHRRYAEGEPMPDRALPVHNSVTSVAFSPEAMWFSTMNGVVRWQEAEVKAWGENEGLESEMANAVAVGPGGQMWVATTGGVGRFDGTLWRFPEGPLRARSYALAKDAREAVWVATDKGLVRANAEGEILLNAQTGLLSDAVRDVTVDNRGRVWALSAEALILAE